MLTEIPLLLPVDVHGWVSAVHDGLWLYNDVWTTPKWGHLSRAEALKTLNHKNKDNMYKDSQSPNSWTQWSAKMKKEKYKTGNVSIRDEGEKRECRSKRFTEAEIMGEKRNRQKVDRRRSRMEVNGQKCMGKKGGEGRVFPWMRKGKCAHRPDNWLYICKQWRSASPLLLQDEKHSDSSVPTPVNLRCCFNLCPPPFIAIPSSVKRGF